MVSFLKTIALISFCWILKDPGRSSVYYLCDFSSYLFFLLLLYCTKCYRSWQNVGVMVAISTKNLLINDNHISLINKANKLGDVEGIFIINQPRTQLLDIMNKASNNMCPKIK